jgi:decaprenylphospho-beta-D-ribofuranose 2-oxidase
VGGSYYLPVDKTASREQFRRAYPRWREFAELKRRYDPDTLFTSEFHQRVFAPEH